MNERVITAKKLELIFSQVIKIITQNACPIVSTMVSKHGEERPAVISNERECDFPLLRKPYLLVFPNINGMPDQDEDIFDGVRINILCQYHGKPEFTVKDYKRSKKAFKNFSKSMMKLEKILADIDSNILIGFRLGDFFTFDSDTAIKSYVTNHNIRLGMDGSYIGRFYITMSGFTLKTHSSHYFYSLCKDLIETV